MPEKYLEEMDLFFRSLGLDVSSNDTTEGFVAALTPSEKPVFPKTICMS